MPEQVKRELGQALPDRSQLEHEAFHGSLARQFDDATMRLDWMTLAINVDRFGIAVNQPSKLRAVRDPLLHLRLGLFQAVARRHHFHNELRTQVQKLFSLLPGKTAQGRIRDDRSVAKCLIAQFRRGFFVRPV